MQCNIDSKGKAARLISGLIVTVVGVLVIGALIAGFVSGWLWWTAAVVILAGGLFQIYEGWAGWCVVRAMGFKTPM